MAYKIVDLTRSVAAGGDYPRGDIKDNPNGTLVDRKMMTDPLQFFAKLMEEAGITPNSQPDNDANGYQLYAAFTALTGINAWTAGASPTYTTNNSPIGTVSGGSVVVNRYQIVGKTIKWHLRVTGLTIAGAPTSIYISGPVTGQSYKNTNCRYVGMYNDVSNLIVTTAGPTAPMQITLTLAGGGAFTNGTSNQNIDVWFITELT
jgi:hypothetical protein